MIAEAEGVSLENTFKGKTVAISGSGNVAQYAALKVSKKKITISQYHQPS
jgi:glutamate dehydrogenase/leucine dehydrogenase